MSIHQKTWTLLGLTSICFWLGCAGVDHEQTSSGPWNLAELRKAPAATWGTETGLVRTVMYEGEPFQGRPTRVFAYYARPAEGPGPFPAMVLVHGGGGSAFPDWARHWAERGYVAIAMDLSGNGPDRKRLPDGGPDQGDETKFREFTRSEAGEMWTYHAVSAVLRAHSLLTTRPEVDSRRIGLTGISWGGYLTCIAAGIDQRFKVAVPVYGCGFLADNSCWLGVFERMTPATRALWTELFDPEQYLGGVGCPILFLNGSNDFAYPLDSYRKSYRLVRGPRTLSVQLRLPHGHIWSFKEVDLFVDAALQGGAPLPKLSALKTKGDRTHALYSGNITNAHLLFTSDTGSWQKRLWTNAPAKYHDGKVEAQLPAARPLVYFLSVTDARGLTVTTAHEELAAAR